MGGLVICLLLALCAEYSYQHGYLEKPPQRASLWRFGFSAPPNYNDNELYCGGIEALKDAGGKCGPCGDPYYGDREHEAGGRYAKGIIAESLPSGATELKAIVKVSSYHMGYFMFYLCVHNNPKKPVTQECLDQTPLVINEGSPQHGYYRYYPEKPWHRADGDRYEMTVLLPTDVVCSQCVLQWIYVTGNSWGTNKDGRSCLGCGIQEEFRNCADISIGEDENTIEIRKTSKQTKSRTTLDSSPSVKNNIVKGRTKYHQMDGDLTHKGKNKDKMQSSRRHVLLSSSTLASVFQSEWKLLQKYRERSFAALKRHENKLRVGKPTAKPPPIGNHPKVKVSDENKRQQQTNRKSKETKTHAVNKNTVKSWVAKVIKNSNTNQGIAAHQVHKNNLNALKGSDYISTSTQSKNHSFTTKSNIPVEKRTRVFGHVLTSKDGKLENSKQQKISKHIDAVKDQSQNRASTSALYNGKIKKHEITLQGNSYSFSERHRNTKPSLLNTELRKQNNTQSHHSTQSFNHRIINGNDFKQKSETEVRAFRKEKENIEHKSSKSEIRGVKVYHPSELEADFNTEDWSNNLQTLDGKTLETTMKPLDEENIKSKPAYETTTLGWPSRTLQLPRFRITKGKQMSVLLQNKVLKEKSHVSGNLGKQQSKSDNNEIHLSEAVDFHHRQLPKILAKNKSVEITRKEEKTHKVNTGKSTKDPDQNDNITEVPSNQHETLYDLKETDKTNNVTDRAKISKTEVPTGIIKDKELKTHKSLERKRQKEKLYDSKTVPSYSYLRIQSGIIMQTTTLPPTSSPPTPIKYLPKLSFAAFLKSFKGTNLAMSPQTRLPSPRYRVVSGGEYRYVPDSKFDKWESDTNSFNVKNGDTIVDNDMKMSSSTVATTTTASLTTRSQKRTTPPVIPTVTYTDTKSPNTLAVRVSTVPTTLSSTPIFSIHSLNSFQMINSVTDPTDVAETVSDKKKNQFIEDRFTFSARREKHRLTMPHFQSNNRLLRLTAASGNQNKKPIVNPEKSYLPTEKSTDTFTNQAGDSVDIQLERNAEATNSNTLKNNRIWDGLAYPRGVSKIRFIPDSSVSSQPFPSTTISNVRTTASMTTFPVTTMLIRKENDSYQRASDNIVPSTIQPSSTPTVEPSSAINIHPLTTQPSINSLVSSPIQPSSSTSNLPQESTTALPAPPTTVTENTSASSTHASKPSQAEVEPTTTVSSSFLMTPRHALNNPIGSSTFQKKDSAQMKANANSPSFSILNNSRPVSTLAVKADKPSRVLVQNGKILRINDEQTTMPTSWENVPQRKHFPDNADIASKHTDSRIDANTRNLITKESTYNDANQLQISRLNSSIDNRPKLLNSSQEIVIGKEFTQQTTTPHPDISVVNLEGDKYLNTNNYRMDTNSNVRPPVISSSDIVDIKTERIRPKMERVPTTTPLHIEKSPQNHYTNYAEHNPFISPGGTQEDLRMKIKKRYDRAVLLLKMLRESPLVLLQHPIFSGYSMNSHVVSKLMNRLQRSKLRLHRLLYGDFLSNSSS